MIDAAITAMAQRGYFGTSTTEIAGAAGLSQAYLYRLFPNKEALFVAVLHEVKSRMRHALEAVAEEWGESSDPVDGSARFRALADIPGLDRDAATVLQHASSASREPAIRAAVIECYRDQVEFLRRRFDASDADIRWFIALGQLSTNLDALELDDARESWVSALRP